MKVICEGLMMKLLGELKNILMAFFMEVFPHDVSSVKIITLDLNRVFQR